MKLLVSRRLVLLGLGRLGVARRAAAPHLVTAGNHDIDDRHPASLQVVEGFALRKGFRLQDIGPT